MKTIVRGRGKNFTFLINPAGDRGGSAKGVEGMEKEVITRQFRKTVARSVTS